MSNNNKSKSAPAKSNVAVIKSAPVPANQQPRDYMEFDRFDELGGNLAWNYGYLCKLTDELEAALEEGKGVNSDLLRRGERELELRPSYEKKVARYQALVSYYERDELYDRVVEEDSGRERWQIKASVVSEQMALLIGSFPNAGPHSPEVFTKMLLEEVRARKPSAAHLEAACRALRRTKNFVVTIAEVLKAIDDAEGKWSGRNDAAGLDDPEDGGCGLFYILEALADIVEQIKARLKPPAPSREQK
jgi:hypothetical protein